MKTARLTLGMLLLASLQSLASTTSAPSEAAEKKLRDAAVSPELIALVSRSSLLERDRIVELNVLGFLGKADYSTHYSEQAVKKCREFTHRNIRRLRLAETTYGVPKEVIVSLLWVETKLGKRVGHYPIGEVYFSLLQADHPDVVRNTLNTLQSRIPPPSPAALEEYRKKALERSASKAAWALSELKSLDEIRRRDPKRAAALQGSYAGAFGLPQFIPSSYVQWARTGARARQPDLSRVDDAIRSVAYYLQAHGWKTVEPATHQSALFGYNHAQGYVDVILKLALRSKPDP